MKRVANGAPFSLGELERLPVGEFRDEVVRSAGMGGRLAALFRAEGALVAVMAMDESGTLSVFAGDLDGKSSYPSLAMELPQAQAFERDLWECEGIEPSGHPWLKPLAFPRIPEGEDIPSGYGYYSSSGDQVHEVAVGPVHAGIIEPGHFRFQCHGEEVLHLEIQLGYQYRGAERILREAGLRKRTTVAESVAGDSVVAHATAFAMTEEALSGTQVPARAQAVRAIALELERIANHAGDLGALAGDVGYLPAASFFGRLRGDFLNITQGLCGNRFGRGLVVPGGVAFDADGAWVSGTLRSLAGLRRDLQDTAGLLFGSASVQARFEGTGILDFEKAQLLGVVGPAARASGCRRDVRREHPWGFYRFEQVPPQTLSTGDVYARAMVRWLEIQQSLRFIEEHAASLPGGATWKEAGPRRPGTAVVAMTEGWRGETVHAAVSGAGGGTQVYKVADPSLRNWMGLAVAMRGGAISDFPLCNKSFNLSYAGNDR